MKKVISMVASLLAVCLLLTSCSGISDKNKIEKVQAERLIKLYTAEELGLTQKEMDGASLLSDSEIQELDGVKYYSIIYANMTENEEPNENGETTYSIKDIGNYYVTLDGNHAYKFNSETSELTELPKKEVPTLSPQEAAALKGETIPEDETHTHSHSDEEATEHTHVHTHDETTKTSTEHSHE